ncbi:hypothetical protein ACHAPT_009126 [Fusarium lateritium]
MTMQQPFWLRKTALLAFSLTFIACAVALITLNRFIVSRNGLPLLTSSEYSWTYGPTGLLVIILSFWRQIDYYYKSTQPWKELLKGAASPEKSLLLDYISAFQPTSIFQALKMRHYSVAGTTLSFFLLKLIILISTTLFVVQPSFHHGSFDIEYGNAFDGAAAWTSGDYSDMMRDPSETILRGGSDKPVWAYLARINNATPPNTTWRPQDDLVTQSFSVPESKQNITTLKVNVDVFVPKISCESAALSVTMDKLQRQPLYELRSNTCSVAGLEPYMCPDAEQGSGGLQTFLCGDTPRVYTILRANCSQGVNGDPRGGRNWPDDVKGHDIRYAITAAHLQFQTNGTDRFSATVESFQVLNSSSAICKIGYEIVSAKATHDIFTGQVTFSERSPGRQLHGLAGYEMAQMLLAALSKAAGTLTISEDIPTVGSTNNIWSRADETLFQLMVARLGNPDDLNVFYEPSVLEKTSALVLEGLANEFARQSLLVANTSRGLADGVAGGANRLYVRPVALWVMVAAFALLAVISLLIMTMTSSISWIPAMSGSVAGQAAILVKSPSLQAILRNTGHLRGSQLKERLSGMLFTAASDGTRAIQVQQDVYGPAQQLLRDEKQKKKRPWMPLSARRPLIAALAILPILAIAALECLHRLSEKWHGLVDLNGRDSDVLSYIVRLVSTLIAFGISTMFNNLDFTIVMFAPFSSLRSGSVDADKGILLHLLGESPFKVLFKSLRRRQFGAASSNLSSIIGGFLTIAVSGLWILTGPFSVESPTTASINNWDESWLNNTLDDGGAAITLNLIRREGANTSTRIWKDVVLPRIDMPSASTPNAGHRGTNYTYSVEVLRPTLNCTVVAQENIKSKINSTLTSKGGSISDPGMWYKNNITVYAPVRPECVGGPGREKGNLTFGILIENWRMTWIAQYSDLDHSLAGQVGTDCPSVGILFGDVEGDDVTGKSIKTWNLTALVCSQGIEQIPATITFKGDSSLGEIDAQQPPVLSQSKARSWRNGTAATLGYKLKGFLDAHLTFFTPQNRDLGQTRQDSFFDQLISGPGGHARDELLGPNNANRLIKAVKEDHEEYMRHVIDANFRAGSDSNRSSLVRASGGTSLSTPSGANTEIVGTVSQAVTRLAIHPTSKLILQVLLGSMMILGLVGYCLVKLRGTLPRNPTSIASIMSLLAGSQLCDPNAGIIPEGAGLMSDEKLKKAFNGWSLGKLAVTLAKGIFVDISIAVTDELRAVSNLYGEDVRPRDHITGFRSGAIVAVKNFHHGIFEALTDLAVYTFHGKRQEEALGAAKGLGKGALSLVTKTTAATIGLVAYPAQGIHRSIHPAVVM